MPTSPAARSTCAATCATFSSALRRARPRRGSPRAPSRRCSSPASASRSRAESSRSARSAPDGRRPPGRRSGGWTTTRRCAPWTPRSRPRWCAPWTKRKPQGDTLGGAVTIIAHGVPVGLGSHVAWNDKLDGRIAQAMMSVPAVKAVELGSAIAASRGPGSAAHDAILQRSPDGRFPRATNRAGGLEGGITNGEDVVVTLYKKPIATLRAGLPSVDLDDLGQRRAASLAVRAQRRHGAAGRRRHRRGDARPRPRRRLPREVRRRLDGRAPRARRRQPRPRPPLAARLSPPRPNSQPVCVALPPARLAR